MTFFPVMEKITSEICIQPKKFTKQPKHSYAEGNKSGNISLSEFRIQYKAILIKVSGFDIKIDT